MEKATPDAGAPGAAPAPSADTSRRPSSAPSAPRGAPAVTTGTSAKAAPPTSSAVRLKTYRERGARAFGRKEKVWEEGGVRATAAVSARSTGGPAAWRQRTRSDFGAEEKTEAARSMRSDGLSLGGGCEPRP